MVLPGNKNRTCACGSTMVLSASSMGRSAELCSSLCSWGGEAFATNFMTAWCFPRQILQIPVFIEYDIIILSSYKGNKSQLRLNSDKKLLMPSWHSHTTKVCPLHEVLLVTWVPDHMMWSRLSRHIFVRPDFLRFLEHRLVIELIILENKSR